MLAASLALVAGLVLLVGGGELKRTVVGTLMRIDLPASVDVNIQ